VEGCRVGGTASSFCNPLTKGSCGTSGDLPRRPGQGALNLPSAPTPWAPPPALPPPPPPPLPFATLAPFSFRSTSHEDRSNLHYIVWCALFPDSSQSLILLFSSFLCPLILARSYPPGIASSTAGSASLRMNSATIDSRIASHIDYKRTITRNRSKDRRSQKQHLSVQAEQNLSHGGGGGHPTSHGATLTSLGLTSFDAKYPSIKIKSIAPLRRHRKYHIPYH
jgi:hypothetical protein